MELVVDFEPFRFDQTVYVVDNDRNIVKTLQTDMATVIQAAKEIGKDFSVNKITLIGNSDFLRHYEKEFKTEFQNCQIGIVGK